MTTPLQRPNKETILFLELEKVLTSATFEYARYVDQAEDMMGPGGETFTAVPQLSVEKIRLTGGLEDPAMRFTLPLDSFTDRLSNGEIHAQVNVSLYEVFKSDYRIDGKQMLLLHRGQIRKTIRNHNGTSDQIVIDSVNAKSELSTSLGFQVMAQCPWTLGGRGCGVDVVALRETGTLTVIDRRIGTITGLGTHLDKYWHRGYASRDGINLGVRDWSLATPTSFVFVREVPADWVGQSVVVTPGCDKTPGVCFSRYNNLAKFGGAGLVIPPYHPVFEDSL